MEFPILLIFPTTCRTARKAMAMGKRLIAARRGMLPELIPHKKAGLVIDDTPENLADAMVRLANDTALRKQLGQGARQHALTHFQVNDQAESNRSKGSVKSTIRSTDLPSLKSTPT